MRAIRELAADLGAAVVAATLSRRISRLGVRTTSDTPHTETLGPRTWTQRWARTNFAGRPVSLLAGPAAVAGLSGGAFARILLRPDRRAETAAALVAALGAGAVGAYDDLYGTTQAKGFGGHLRALRRGELTSGMIKIAGVGASAVIAAVIISADRSSRTADRVIDVTIDSALVAGLANLVNLFDLRPGRAGKVSAMLALAGLSHGSSVVLGAVAGELGDDLAGATMLGDTGANALGAAAGVAIAGRSRPVRVGVLGLVGALTLASERVSFTAVIERTGWLRALDRLGRPSVTSTP